jgi:hypothetical protein
MIIASVIVGLLVAYYFGLRAGMYAAGATAAAFLAAAIVPPLALWAYLAVGAGVVGVCFVGPKLGKPPKGGVFQLGKKLVDRARQASRFRDRL